MNYIKIIFIILSVFFALTVYGNKPPKSKDSVQVSVADMDWDGIPDSLIHNFENEILTIKLSSQDFKPFSTFYPGIYDSYPIPDKKNNDIQAHEGGFSANSPCIMSDNTEIYSYDPETGKFRLSEFSREERRTCCININLDEGIFSAEWRWVIDRDSLVTYPHVEFDIYHAPFYLGEVKPDFIMMACDLFYEYREVYTPLQVDTVRFVEVFYKYDLYEDQRWDNVQVVYVDKNATRRFEVTTTEPLWPWRDDLVEISTSNIFFHDIEEERYRVIKAVTDISYLKPGRYYDFIMNLRYFPSYNNQSSFTGKTAELIQAGIEYYFVLNEDERYKKYMDKTGRPNVVYTNINRDKIWKDEWQYGITVEIIDNIKRKNKSMGKFIMGVTYDRDFLYYDKDMNRIL